MWKGIHMIHIQTFRRISGSKFGGFGAQNWTFQEFRSPGSRFQVFQNGIFKGSQHNAEQRSVFRNLLRSPRPKTEYQSTVSIRIAVSQHTQRRVYQFMFFFRVGIPLAIHAAGAEGAGGKRVLPELYMIDPYSNVGLDPVRTGLK